MKDGFWLWRPDVRRRLNTTLLFLFVFSNYFPMGVAMASPGWYARPGLGVSRLPLEVMTFDAPGFGDLEQAVNLANGNLYVGLDQVAYNSQSQPGMTGSSTLSENLNLIGQGNGWNYAPRLRLENWVRRGGSGEQIGGGWWFTKYISGDNGVIYAANSAGDLFWYRWMTNPDGSGYWHPNSGKKIGAGGWTFADYVWGGNGIIYPVDSAGNMYWYRRVDDLDGNGYWHPNSGAWNRIGSGWGFRNLIAGENGIIYAIDWGGGMHWYRRINDLEGTGSWHWKSDYSNVIGSGWSFAHYVSGGNGIIYAVDGSGNVYWYRRVNDLDGSGYWHANSGGSNQIRTGWGFNRYIGSGGNFYTLNSSGAVFWYRRVNDLEGTGSWYSSSLADYPANLFLGSGDGSGSIFSKMTPGSSCQNPAQSGNPTFTWNASNDAADACVPSWIQRYKDAYSANPSAYAFYGLFPQPGLKYASEWIVLVQNSQGTFAHYYTKDGTRYTFNADGPYTDYAQTLYQQLKSAQAGDPEGRTGPKTEFEYWDTNLGLIKKVRDEWGRTTVYDWDLATQRLNSVRVLTLNEGDPNDWVRKIEFSYPATADASGRYPLTGVTFKVNNYYLIPDTQRAYEFVYDPGTTRLNKLRVQTAGGWRETSYTYENGRIKTVAEQGRPAITYAYDTSGANNPYKGLLVTQTQTDSSGFKKESRFFFDNQNQLRRREVNDTNPNGTDTSGNQTDPGNKTLAWEYTYYQTGNLGLVTEVHTGKTTHYAYDGRGNLIRESVYQNRDLWSGQGQFPPIAVMRSFASSGTTRPGDWVTGIGSPFSIAVEVQRDALEQGVDWYYVPVVGSVEGTPQLITTSSSPVALESQAITARSGRAYTVTANFKPISAHGTYGIRAVVRNRLPNTPEQYAQATVNIAKRVKVEYGPVGGSTAVSKIIVAPSCLRVVAGGQYSGGCLSEVPVNVTFTFADWVPREQYATYAQITPQTDAASTGVNLSQRVGSLNIDPIRPTATAQVYLSLNWASNSSLIKQDRTVSLWVQPAVENLPATNALRITLGFFGVEKVYGRYLSNSGALWFPNETKDGAYYQIALRVFNSPGIIPPGRSGAGQPLKLLWYTDAAGGNVGRFGYGTSVPGCFFTWSRWWWEYYSGNVYAEITGYPELTQSEFVEMHAWQNWRSGDGCADSAASVNYEGTVGGLGLQSTVGSNTIGSAAISGLASGLAAFTYNGSTSNYSSGSYTTKTTANSLNTIYSSGSIDQVVADVRSSTDPATDLSSALRDNYQYYREYAYDADNRLLRAATRGAQSFHPVAALKATDYSEVRSEYAYTNLSAVSASQSFRATDTVSKSDYVGAELRRKTIQDYDSFGRLEKDRLEWDANWRETAYTYWQGSSSDLPQTTSLWQINDGAPTRQWGDLVKTVATTTSAQNLNIPGHVTSKQVSYAYDLLGYPVWESINGGVADSASSSGVTTGGTRLIERMFDGFGNRFWEGRSTNGKRESVRGWSYYGTGELQNEFSYYYGNGGDIRLTAYSYDAYGRLIRKQSGEGNQYWFGTVKPETVSGQVDYTYDEWGRIREEKVLNDVGDGSFTTTFSYDSLDRPVKKKLPDGTEIKTWYDLYGEVSKTDEPKAVHIWRRSWDNFVFTLIDSVGAKAGYGTGYTLTHKYDEFGRTLQTLYNNLGGGDGATAKYAYDSEGYLLGEVGPRLRPDADPQSPPRWLEDARRSGVTYSYDKLGRKVGELRVLYGNVVESGANLGHAVSDPALNSAGTTYVYDHLDRLVRVIDPEGYYSETAYDAADQPFMSRRGFTPGASPSFWSTTYTRYDAAGRVTDQVDPEGYLTSKRYDTAGNLRAEADQRGYITKRYAYNPSGLLLGIYEPVVSAPGTPNTDGAKLANYAFDPANPNNIDPNVFQLTQWLEYGKRGLPLKVYKATQNSLPSGNFATGAGSGGAVTSYTYAWHGKPTTTTLPADAQGNSATVSQDYDYQGNLTAVTDADGFKTLSVYDWAGRLLSQQQPARVVGGSTSPVDSAAGLSGGLTSSYLYDAFGNLLRKNERGLVTDYIYNSLGKVIAESRPTYSANPPAYPLASLDGQAVRYKKYVYRLDGGKMAETSYTYADSNTLRDAQDDAGGLPGGSSAPLFSAGNLQVFRQDKLGNLTGEFSYGYGSDGVFRVEKQVLYSYNGLGLRSARDFIGHKDIYANQRDPLSGEFLGKAGGGNLRQPYPYSPVYGSTDPVTEYSTYWSYDRRGKLLKQWDEVNTGTSPRPKLNEFTYTYSATGKEIKAERDVQVRVSKLPGGSSSLAQNPLLAATVGKVESDYNERDQLKETRVYDQSPGGLGSEGLLEPAPANPQRTTRYRYYADGSKQQEEVLGVGNKSYSYDLRGRVSQVVDSNGSLNYTSGQPLGDGGSAPPPRVGDGSATITTRYLAGGVREEKVQWNGPKSCTIQTTYTPTVGGLMHKVERSDTCQDLPDPNRPAAPVTSRTPYVYTYTYDLRGLAVEERGDQTLTRGLLEPSATPSTQTVTITVRSSKLEYNSDYSLKERVIETTTASSGYSYEGGDVPAKTEKTTTRQANSYTAEGYLTGEMQETTLPAEATWGYTHPTANGAMTTASASTYTLDSRGNRLSTNQTNYNLTLQPNGSVQRSSDTAGGYSGYIKRYNADDRAVMFYKYVVEAKQAAYSDFAYDPSGNQVLSSSAAFKHNSSGYVVSRDQNANYFVNGEVQATRKRAGVISKYPASYFLWWQVTSGEQDTYSASDTYKDQTYSLADGHADTTKWAAVVLFEGRPSHAAEVFQAPVKPTSVTVGVDPLTVQAPDTVTPPSGGVPPSEVKPPSAPAAQGQADPSFAPQSPTGRTIGQGQTAGTVQGLGPADRPGFSIAGALEPLQPLTPALEQPQTPPASSDTPAVTNPPDPPAAPQQAEGDGGFKFQAPLSVLPPSIEAVSPSSVALPNQAASPLPAAPDPATVATPGQASPPPTTANPQDGPITVAPPIRDSSPPPVSPGGDDRRVKPPTGWVPGGQPENREAQLFVIYVSREQWEKIQESGLADDLEEALRLDQAMRDGKLGDQQARERAQQLVEDVRRKLNNLDQQGVLLYGEMSSLNKILDAVSKFQDPLEKVAITGKMAEYFLLEFDAARRADTFYQMANSAYRLLQSADGVSKQKHKEVMWSRLGQGFGKVLQAMDTMARDAYQMSGGYWEDAKAYAGAVADYILENPVEAIGLVVGLGLTLAEAVTFLPVALTTAAYYGARLSAGAQNFLARVQAIQAQQARLGISANSWIGGGQPAGNTTILFGQKRIAPQFQNYGKGSDKIKGKSLLEVAEGLRSGNISPDEILIEYVVLPTGERVTMNNRGLAALTMAGMRPTNTRQVAYNSVLEERLTQSLKNYPMPGYRILVSVNKDGSNPLYSVFIPPWLR